MSLLIDNPLSRYRVVAGLVKASEAFSPVYAMTGRLYVSGSGWLLLSVPNGLVRAVFDTLAEPGVELPTRDGILNAHISVMRPEELKRIGGESRITERGHAYHYQIGKLVSGTPLGWENVSRVWALQVSSPELSALRRSYGLSALPERNGETLPFHLTVAIRRRHVLRDNGVSKLSEDTLAASLRAARKATDTTPSEAQQEAGNYAKGRFRWQGLDISLENPEGSVRRGVDASGKAWETKMKHDYGYFRRTVGADSDHVDCFIGPSLQSDRVFVVNQIDPETKKFDEHKVMIGFVDEAEARAGYLANYSDDWKGLGSLKSMSLDQFKTWLQGDTTKAAASKRQSLQKLVDSWSPADPGYGHLWYNAEEDKVWIVSGDGDDGDVTRQWIADVESLGVSKVDCESEYTPREFYEDDSPWVRVDRKRSKSADVNWTFLTAIVSAGLHGANR